MTIADVNHYSALRTPADFKTFLHVKFPNSKSRQIGPELLERVNDQHSRGDQKTIRGPHLPNSEKKIFQSWFWNSPPNSQHLSLQVNKCHITSQHHRFRRCCLRKSILRNLVRVKIGVINS